MTIEEANGMIGAWVKTRHAHGGGSGGAGKIGGQLVGVRGHKLLVKIPGIKDAVEKDHGDVSLWKSRTVQNGRSDLLDAKPPEPLKAVKIESPKAAQVAPSPAVVSGTRTSAELFVEFDAARAELEQWADLEKACKEDLEQAKMGYDLANTRVCNLRKELTQRINF